MTEYIYTGPYYDTLREALGELRHFPTHDPQKVAKALHMDPVMVTQALVGWAVLRERYGK